MSKCLKNRTICGRRQYECHGSPCHSLPCYADWRYRPPIQVVLCSTTEDFQEERDYLEHHVFPFLNKLCKSRRSSLKVLDMQWTSHEGHHRANTDSHKLKVSLDLITKISPFFICMLGQKYGEYCPPDMEHFPASGTDAETLSSVERNIQIAARNGYSWILHENYQNCSLLELQIIEAALMNDSGFSFFYFRDSRYVEDLLLNAAPDETEMIEHKYKSKDEHEKQMIMKLKEKIVNEGIPVESFRTIEELGDVIMRNCCDVIDKLYPMDLVPLQTDRESYLEMCYHQASLQRHCQGFVETKEMKEIFGILNKFAVSFLKNEAIGELPKSGCPFLFNKMAPSRLKPVPKGKSVLLLCGEKGCGKSTVICNWLKYFTQTNPSILVINHFVGSSSASYDIMSFMRHCILKLRHEYFGAEDHPDTFSENPADLWVFQMIHKAFIAAISLKPCLLVLDGVDQLTGSRGMSAQQVKKFSWLPWPLPDQCRLIVTTASSSLSYKSLLRHKEVHMVQFFNKITDKVRSHIFHQHLAMPYKEINENQIQNILSRKLSSLPLVLVILANELRVCGAFRNETDCLEEYLQCRSVQDLWAAVFKRWIEDYSWVTEKRTCNREKEISYSCAHSSISGMKGWVVDILCLLSVSRYGLNEEDIQQLLKDLGYKDTNEISSFDWALFRTATMAWIQERPDGLLNFTHQSIRDAVEYLLLGVIAPVNESTSNSYQNHFNHKKTLSHQLFKEYLAQQKYTLKLYQELPWHLEMSGNLHDLCTIVSDPLIHLSKLLEAENYFKQALDIRQKWYGKLHPVVAEILEPLADLLCYPKYSKSLDWSQSKKFYKEVLKIQEDSMQRARSSETRDQINLHRAITLYKLGKLLKNDGNCQARKETAERLRHSFDLLTELLGPNHHLTMEVRRLLKHVEKQICKDRTELIIDSPKISTSFLPKKYDQAESDLQCPYERLKMHHNSKILASSQADSLQMTANANSAQTTHPVDSSKEKSQADVYSDDPVVLEQDIIDDNADLEEECLTNSRSGSNLFISKHALLPRPILWMEQPKSSCPDIKSKLSTSTNKRSMPSSICKPLPTCKVPAFGPNSNTLVPSLRTKVGSERLRIIYQSAWHHPSGLHPALKKPFSSIRHVIKRNPEISWNVYRAKTPRCKAI
ncbi:tetratricopeptide repeat protein 41-like isoform X3 [Chiloscyllium punctatum]|uniref:tetratricopeptide repeat protein 41-like isoform X3 n=1 Tax=Chiloscyllium punctatum TaxID=137246 RepID=UPI003B637BDA